MANSCLLIESYVSFRESIFKDTNRKSERCFGWFFLTEKRFTVFSKNGLGINEYLDLSKKLRNKGIQRDFYRDVRCGILHNAETRNGWKIRRKGPLFNEFRKEINATIFMKNLKDTIYDFRKQLELTEDMNDEIWKNYLDRLKDIMDKS